MLLPEKVFLSWLHLSPDLKEGVLLGGVSIISFPGGSVVKNLSANAGDTGDASSVPGLGRFPGGGNGNPLQCSCLENPMDRGAWWATVCRVTDCQT